MGRKAKDVSPSRRLHCSFLQERNNSLLWAAKMLEEEGTRGLFLFVRGKFAFQAPGFLCTERPMSDDVNLSPQRVLPQRVVERAGLVWGLRCFELEHSASCAAQTELLPLPTMATPRGESLCPWSRQMVSRLLKRRVVARDLWRGLYPVWRAAG